MGCVGKVTPYINNTEGIESWNVDLKNLDKVLTVSGENLDESRIIGALEEAGYSAETISKSN